MLTRRRRLSTAHDQDHAYPQVLAAVMTEVVSFFTATRLPLDGTSFSYRLETAPGSASHPTKSHP
eukprot:gene13136-9405_t